MIRCQSCHQPYPPRGLKLLMARFYEVVARAEGMKEELGARWLRLNLRLLSEELEGHCHQCAFNRVAERRAEERNAARFRPLLLEGEQREEASNTDPKGLRIVK